jgi:hypothetical protein
MYISNTTGILEYDGINWQMVKGTDQDVIFKLCKDKKGKIYAGVGSNIGYLAPDTTGRMQFFSLLPYLKGRYPDLNVLKTAAVGDDIYFLSSNHLFLWNGKKFHVWVSKAGFVSMFAIPDQKLFLLEKEKGLCVLESGHLKEVTGGKALLDFKVTALIPTATRTSSSYDFLVATYNNGLQVFQNQVLTKIKPTSLTIPANISLMHGLR